MAEFQDVTKQAKRMCETHTCGDCPLKTMEGYCRMCFPPDEIGDQKELESIERIVMDWAAKNPEPRYPTLAEAWRRLFPAADLIPCPQKHFGFSCACIGEESCQTCLNRQMYPFIAEKLGIKPIGEMER